MMKKALIDQWKFKENSLSFNMGINVKPLTTVRLGSNETFST